MFVGEISNTFPKVEIGATQLQISNDMEMCVQLSYTDIGGMR